MTIDQMRVSDPVTRTPAGQPHEHTWQLRCVEHVDGCSVREFACVACRAVWFD